VQNHFGWLELLIRILSVCAMFADMAKRTQRMTPDEARAILHRWREREPGERALVLAADKLLADAWEERREQKRKKPYASPLAKEQH
jgi:hypothetical protein